MTKLSRIDGNPGSPLEPAVVGAETVKAELNLPRGSVSAPEQTDEEIRGRWIDASQGDSICLLPHKQLDGEQIALIALYGPGRRGLNSVSISLDALAQLARDAAALLSDIEDAS